MGEVNPIESGNLEQQKAALILNLYDLLYKESSQEGPEADSRTLKEIMGDVFRDKAGMDVAKIREQEGTEKRERVDILLKQIFELDPVEGDRVVAEILKNTKLSVGIREHIKKQFNKIFYKQSK